MIRVGIAVRLAVLLVVQAATLGWMVFDRARLLESGTEVRLAVVPVDPRDLFRGDYVELSYDISTLRPPLLDGDDDFASDQLVWVAVDPGTDGPASPRAVFHEKPDTGDGAVLLRGRIASAFDGAEFDGKGGSCAYPCRTLRVDYGIEQYFVPEGEGRELETLRNDMRVEVVAAVGSDGKAAIKRLLVDGKPRYEEPLL